MKEFHLRFALPAVADHAIFDLLDGDADDIPEEPGAYVLGTADCTVFGYPSGTSPIYYIGCSGNLRSRLIERHRKGTQGAVNDHRGAQWPRHRYGAKYGAHAVWYLAEDVEPKEVKATLIKAFRQTYGSKPVAVGTTSTTLEPPHTNGDCCPASQMAAPT